jgi:hypothetical protein
VKNDPFNPKTGIRIELTGELHTLGDRSGRFFPVDDEHSMEEAVVAGRSWLHNAEIELERSGKRTP